MLRINQLVGLGVAGNTAPPVLTFQATTQSGASTSSYSFTSQAIGAADETRCVIVSIVGASGANIDGSSVTIDGISATVGRASGAANVPVEIWIARVPTGTTATIDVTFTGASNFCKIGVWSVTGLDSTTPTDTDADGLGAILIDVQPAGIVVCAAATINGAGAAWTNATERFDSAIGGFGNSGADYQATVGVEINRSITCTSADANELTVAAAFR